MNKESKRRPILYNGEIYSEPIIKKSGGGKKQFLYSYDEARELVLKDIAQTKKIMNSMPSDKRLPNEVIISLTLQSGFSAKSYYPESLFDVDTAKFGFKEIGSRILREKNINTEDDDESTDILHKTFFVRATENSFFQFEKQLNRRTTLLTETFQSDIRKISSIGFLPVEEQILGVSEEWREGRLEAVLHPFAIDNDLTLPSFLKKIEESGTNLDRIRYKQYKSGVTFISFHANRSILNSISGYNPLRTVHPLEMRSLQDTKRGIVANGGPNAPEYKRKSSIVVGVIDGGVQENNPYLNNYIESEYCTPGLPILDLVEHGTQVSGAVLYGAINNFSTGTILPEPKVSVKNFRVLTTGIDATDPELYDVIDAIEKIIPANKEISVYNLSLGPKGPILDDYISRFTYSCDSLSNDHNVLFCVAVGNDGEIDGFDRIQSPADSVNCLGVGAYTKKDDKIIRAPYSSIGPGREGGKMKPDIMAFGGCDQRPIHLIANEEGRKVWSSGTSFASPIVAGIAGRIIGESNKSLDSLSTKALMIHSTIKHDDDNNTLGHGIVPDDFDSITTCLNDSYTLIYRGEIQPGKYAEFLIPWDENIKKGKAHVRWTAAVLTDVDQLSSDDYTSSAIEVSFYPNGNKYRYENKNRTPFDDGSIKKSEIVDIVMDSDRAEYLEEIGWKKGNFPVSDSTQPAYQTEAELRTDFKWDSIDTRKISKIANGLNEPVFHVHALGRGSRSSNSKVKFVLILTVRTPDADVDIYQNIIAKYSALVPLELRTEIQLDINIDLNSES